MKLLVNTVQEYQGITDTHKAVLIPKLTPTTTSCQVSSEDVFASLRSLGDLVVELSDEDDLYTAATAQGRQRLKSSAEIFSKVTNFPARESHFKFDNLCTKEKKYNVEFISDIGKMMCDLADLYESLGQAEIAAN